MPWCRSPSCGEPAGHGRDREVARVDVVDLVPGDRRGHGRLRHAAHRVGAGDRVVPGVLVVVHEQLGRVAVLAPPGGRYLVRNAALDLAGERVSGPPDVGEPPPRLDPDVDVQAVAAGGLRPPGRAQLAEYLPDDVGHPAHGAEPAAWHGIQVDAPLVRPFGVGPAGVPRVELDRGHLDRPHDAGQFGDAQLVRVPAVAREAHPHGFQPRRRAVRHPLLMHLLARRPRTGNDASCTAARAARARCRHRPTGSTWPGRAWSHRGQGSRPDPGGRCAPSAPRPGVLPCRGHRRRTSGRAPRCNGREAARTETPRPQGGDDRGVSRAEASRAGRPHGHRVWKR